LSDYLSKGFAFDKLRLYNDAINDYTKALDIDSKNAFAYYNVTFYVYGREESHTTRRVTMIKQ
jgi:tetratricopeptide (TPR) repeat protein